MMLLLLHIIVRSLLPPFYSFAMVEGICKNRLRRNAQDKDALWFLANFYSWYGKFAEATWLLESLLKLQADSRAGTLLLSRAFFQLGKHEDVERTLRGSNILSSGDKENYYMGYSLIELGKFRDAIRYLQLYSESFKDNYVAFVKLGYAYYKEGLYNDALSAYKRADGLNPNNKEIQESIILCSQKIDAAKGGVKQSPGD